MSVRANLPKVPPLQNGDRLTRAEFERRYNAMPEVKKAELIEGIVYMPSPVRYEHHGFPHSTLMALFGQYRMLTPGVGSADNTTVRLDDENEPQPDVFLIVRPEYGGRTNLSADGYVEGAPELIAEVSSSTVSIDLNARLRAYERNKVLEYVVWRVEDEAVDWFVLRRGKYRPLAADAEGIIRSGVFPGLWMDVAALLRDDGPALLATLSRGLASAEHAAFVAKLQAAYKAPKT